MPYTRNRQFFFGIPNWAPPATPSEGRAGACWSLGGESIGPREYSACLLATSDMNGKRHHSETNAVTPNALLQEAGLGNFRMIG